MDKKKEIFEKQKRQSELKKEVKRIKQKVPSFLIGFFLIISIALYFLENKLQHIFGNTINLITYVIIFSGIFSLIYIILSYFKIKRKEKQSKAIGIELYNLMKLETNTNNE